MLIRLPPSRSRRQAKATGSPVPSQAEAHTLPSAALDELLTVSDVAKLLKLSERHVRRLISDGMLPACHLGRAVRVQKVDVHAYLSACRRAARGIS